MPEGTFNEYLVRRLEGTHSMYIDAVAQTAGISSYTERDMLPLERHGNGIAKIFHRMACPFGVRRTWIARPSRWCRVRWIHPFRSMRWRIAAMVFPSE